MALVEMMSPMVQQDENILALLDALPFGIVLLDETGCLVRINRLAEQIITEADGLGMERSSLCTAQPSENRRLHQLIDKALAMSRSGSVAASGVLALPRPSWRNPLEVLVTPLGKTTATGLARGRPAVAILVRDPERAPSIHTERLKRLYGLTPTEARIAQGLVLGKAVHEIASDMEVQPNTIRIHLKRIYSKTETRRQGELVRLLAGNLLLSMP